MAELLLTAAAVALALTQPVPQIVRLLRTRSVAGVSGPTTWLGFSVNVGWMAYGVALGLAPVALLSTAYVVGYLVIGWLLLRGGERRGLALGALAGAALAGVAAVAGWTVLGTILAFAVGVQFLPQVREAWTSDDLTALSAGTYLVCVADGLVWGGYGLAVSDLPLVLYGIVMVSVAVAVLVPRQRWVRATRLEPSTAAAGPLAG